MHAPPLAESSGILSVGRTGRRERACSLATDSVTPNEKSALTRVPTRQRGHPLVIRGSDYWFQPRAVLSSSRAVQDRSRARQIKHGAVQIREGTRARVPAHTWTVPPRSKGEAMAPLHKWSNKSACHGPPARQVRVRIDSGRCSDRGGGRRRGPFDLRRRCSPTPQLGRSSVAQLGETPCVVIRTLLHSASRQR